MEFETVIGLEVHAQLLTKSKIFCRCSTAFGAPPNTNTCPVCLGLPGALPVVNREAVAMAVRAGIALGCRINQTSLFARKNYFYPDLPKGYQISQFELPVAEEGKVSLDIPVRDERGRLLDTKERTFRITRLHMEDDAGKSVHVPGSDTLVNLNRTGVPLIEIVTEADFRSPFEAYEFLTYLRRVLLYLEVCDGNMEEGSLRCDANVSIRPVGQVAFGTKTEIKNLNSFRFLRKALKFEIKRQIQVVRQGGKIVQETRLWDQERQVTSVMRSKEEAHDYRYFPEPDLLPLVISGPWLEELSALIPELPRARKARFVAGFGIDADTANLLTQTREFADYFEAAVSFHNNPALIANWMIGDLTRELKKEGREIPECPVPAQQLARLVEMVDRGVISGKIAKDVFSQMFVSGEDPDTIVRRAGLKQISDRGKLEGIIESVLEANPAKVQAFRAGKEGLLGFFVGQVMRETKGQANPKLANKMLLNKLRID